MEKRWAFRIEVVGTIMFLYSVFSLYFWQKELAASILCSMENPFVLLVTFMGYLSLYDGIIYLIASPFICGLKNWARQLIIGYSFIGFLFFLYHIVHGFRYFMVFDQKYSFVLQPRLQFFGESWVTLMIMTFIPFVMYSFFIIFFSFPGVRDQFKHPHPYID